MTSDLYFTQLSEINNFSVEDKRESPLLEKIPDIETFSENSLSFFVSISKNEIDDSWLVTFHMVDKKNNEEHIKKKYYASFYKILMESKNELKETIKQLIENDKESSIQITTQKIPEKNQNKQKENAKDNNNIEEKHQKSIPLENLSGTWKGEENIDKIVILRGGRGFVIFNNGASMNIQIKNSTSVPNQIIVTQNSKSNASFFPELPRNIALQAAVQAEPIQWILNINDENTLKGIKQTLLLDGDNCKKGEIPVEWNKQ